ncbi:MAG: metal-dependent transcriptional regulator [Saprospiraceae bacterium]|jgi:DtxR family Mn-dependent transcriptional regulator|nr:metal-dependent transcriptional regulator [Saprospiraceae bacterium]
MEILTPAEENYLKTIFKLTESDGGKAASTNAIAAVLGTAAASVTDMLKRLSAKGLLHYEKHRGASLTERGNELATNLVRRHRLWETFLVMKLGFSWDAVHDIAEQLEHVQSSELVERLDAFLDRPKFDPHGDPIPDTKGRMASRKQVQLSALAVGEKAVVVGVQESQASFLQYLDRVQISLGAALQVLEQFDYDGSMRVAVQGKDEYTFSQKVCENLYVQKTK